MFMAFTLCGQAGLCHELSSEFFSLSGYFSQALNTGHQEARRRRLPLAVVNLR